MALFGKFLYRKLPEGLLLEISERVFVFGCCFTTNLLEDTEYQVYIGHIVNQLREYFSDTSFMVHNFAEENYQSQISNLPSKYGITVMNYPHQYASCLLLPLETIHHFLNSSVNWLSIGQRNVLLMHCENGALSVLAFMLAAFLIYSKQYTDEWKTLDMIYKQVPQELLQMLSSVNLLPLQLRYLEYVSTRKIDLQWAPTARVLKLDCVILRFVPDMDGKGGCRPIVRIYGLDADQATKMLFSMPTKSEAMRYFKQADLELVKIDINCHVRGDVVLECVALDDDSLEHEEMMFHVMFNTAFIRSNTLALNLEEIDTLWNVKDRPPKDFRAEVLFSEMDSSCSLVSLDLPGKKGKEDFPMEACGKIQDIFSNIDSRDSEASNALAMIKQMEVSIDEQLGNVQNDVEKSMTSGFTQNEAKSSTYSPQTTQKGKFSSVSCDSVKDVGDFEAFENVTTSPPAVPSETPPATSKTHNNSDYTAKKIESSKLQQVSVQRLSQPKIILPRISSSQVSSVPLSRYRSAISALGITAILQDHAEFSSNEARCPLTPESSTSASPPLPLPPHPSSIAAAHPCLPSTLSKLPPPPPSHPLMKTTKPCSLSSVPSPHPIRDQPVASAIPPPPPPPCSTVSIPAKKSTLLAAPSPPPPPQRACSPSRCSPSPPMCPPRSRQVVPPPPAPLSNGLSKSGCTSLQMHSSPLGAKGKLQLQTSTRFQAQQKKISLKPYHWLKLTRAMQGSLWAEAQKPEEASNVLELDISELESLFSTTFPNSNRGCTGGKTDRRGLRLKPDKVHLIELRRAYNCEIMLTKVKVPLSDLMTSVLALDDSALDIDQVDNLIKFCPTKAEIELLKNYTGDKENLGKCEQFFLELMKVPRVESKLRVFSFKIQFCSQVSDLRNSLNIVNSASQEVRNSVKLKRIMQSILSLGNALNHGTARGSAVGFRLDSLLKLSETRSRNNKLTLIHYLCKVLAEKLPEVLDFYEDLVSLEDATKIQLKYLAEEMQAISKGLEKVVQELTASENDGAVTKHFCKTLTGFYVSAEEEVRSLASTYSVVGRNADALAVYFGEDPARCPFEQVVSTLLNFVRMFRRAHEENRKQMEFEKKKAQKELEIGKGKSNASRKELEMRF